MRGHPLRKLLVVLIVIIPVFSTDCKKQPRCGCTGDVLTTLTLDPSTVVFNSDGSVIYFTPLSEPLNVYNFCNPSEIFPKLADYKSGDILLVSGKVFWDCNYIYQASNSYYQSYGKQFQILGSDVTTNLYGGKKQSGVE
jgi:hypothetical protein